MWLILMRAKRCEPEDRINFYPDSMDVTVTFRPASSAGAGPPLVAYGKCVMVPS